MPDKFNCEHKDCNSHGNCTLDSKGIPYCNCQDDYVGENCEKKISRCSPNSKEPLSCERGGRCRQQDDLEYCECVAGSTGTNCETSLHECRWDSCKNNAQCETLVDGVYCSCSPGYFGERCEKAVDPCEVRGAVCGNGKCVANAEGYDGDYTCECAPGYDPLTNCLSPLDPCINNKCQSGSICQPTGVNSYVCLCADGMQGEFCDTEIVYCIKGICLNGGTCTQYLSEDNTLQFRCDCPKDVKGTNCEILPDPCASFQCQHNGYCIVLQSGEPYCKCKDNYSGAHCEKPPSLCDDPNYCNSGECIRAKDGYDYCNCPVETTGLRCETQKK
ncbi:hypothetical protein M3Y94_00271700 [Aphelenchoides besseyi]|nr:hypothetical protein M3Y94_00271700 [Aphelenchoides besseyi]